LQICAILPAFVQPGPVSDWLSFRRNWCPSFTGSHAYYPSRGQSSPALKLLVDALRQGI
jgi:DNA-binding transcriptional LysR family regulator